MKWNLFSSGRVFAAVFGCLLLAFGSASAEKSMWQKFKDFFSPSESFECDSGANCDEIHRLESQISRVEGKYSRERRQVNKDRYARELDSLNVVRDSLVAVVKAEQANKASQVDSQKVSSSAQLSSSVVAVSSSSEVAKVACVPDTVFVRDTVLVHDTLMVADTSMARDTVVVHDTLYVVVTNKPSAQESNPAK